MNKTQQTLFHMHTWANDRRNSEDRLFNERTSAFLAASAFLFAGFCILFTSDQAVLSIVTSLSGLFLAFLQNRWARSALFGRNMWDMLSREIELASGMALADKNLEELMWRPLHDYFASTRLAPFIIHQFWLPGILGALWIASLVLSCLSLF